MNEPRRLVGTESSVRIDAQVIGDEIRPGSKLPLTYEITNLRSTPIAVAELVPHTTFDIEANTFTVNIGSEVPGNELLPRLVEIAPGEKQTFRITANIQPIMPPHDLSKPRPPAEFRIKVNFLGDTKPFRALIGIQERAVADSKLADELFNVWLEANEIVTTNSVPMKWSARRPVPAAAR